ncbi:MAG: hypothetical protein CM1200mP10_21310 [Candidatus Neomarinimicrobiota bacterium]|nr:MAG: hypothetical protein CM1200mP10_21310 [Candidatus Neomarinimicrobiota bacterium]
MSLLLLEGQLLYQKLKLKKMFGEYFIIIDDFGYRDDHVSEGFLSLDADLTFAVIPGHQNSKVFAAKADQKGMRLLCTCPWNPLMKHVVKKSIS